MKSAIEKYIDIQLDSYDTVGLEEIEASNLIDRYDSKYVFDISLLPFILFKLKDYYNILEINDHRSFTYENLYFDTSELDFYRQHHNGKLNRYKVRMRKYLETDTCFFELKYKSNKSLTIKERVQTKDIQNTIDGDLGELVQSRMDIKPEDLKPQLTVKYRRITLLHKNIQEKLTFDTHLYFKNSVKDNELPNLVIAEVKHGRDKTRPEFIKHVKEYDIYYISLSKYCTGTVLTHPDVKYNKLKPKLIFLNKLSEKKYAKHRFSRFQLSRVSKIL